MSGYGRTSGRFHAATTGFLAAVLGIVVFYLFQRADLPREHVWHSAEYGSHAVIYGPAEIELRGAGYLHRVSHADSKIGVYEFRNRKGTLHVYAYAAAIFVNDMPHMLAKNSPRFPEIDVHIKQLSAAIDMDVYATPTATVIFRWEKE